MCFRTQQPTSGGQTDNSQPTIEWENDPYESESSADED